MNDSETTFANVKQRLAEFNKERDWDRYHNPKDLAISLSIESAELLENFQWQPPKDAEKIGNDPEKLGRIKDEMADMFIYLLILANRLEVDVASTVMQKIEKNEPAGPPPTTATRDPSFRARSDPSSATREEKESATDACEESLISEPFGWSCQGDSLWARRAKV